MFVHRQHANREISNYDALVAECTRRNCNIEFIVAEDIGDGLAQAEYFSKVDVMIGVEGAVFAHVLHLPLGSIVIQLHPPRDLYHYVELESGQLVKRAKPYRFSTAMSFYLNHTAVNLMLSSSILNISWFFNVVGLFISGTTVRSWGSKGPQIIDVAEP